MKGFQNGAKQHNHANFNNKRQNIKENAKRFKNGAKQHNHANFNIKGQNRSRNCLERFEYGAKQPIMQSLTIKDKT